MTHYFLPTYSIIVVLNHPCRYCLAVLFQTQGVQRKRKPGPLLYAQICISGYTKPGLIGCAAFTRHFIIVINIIENVKSQHHRDVILVDARISRGYKTWRGNIRMHCEMFLPGQTWWLQWLLLRHSPKVAPAHPQWPWCLVIAVVAVIPAHTSPHGLQRVAAAHSGMSMDCSGVMIVVSAVIAAHTFLHV